MSHSIRLVISIDTEEDNWIPTRHGITVENIRQLPRASEFLTELGLRVTYFTTYQVATSPWAAAILREIQLNGRSEVGAHLHPWNTPPQDEQMIPRHSMLKNLSVKLQEAKLVTLTQALTDAFGATPSTFRAGRFGFGNTTVRALTKCGYEVDSSVIPFVSFEGMDDGADFIGAPIDVYRVSDACDVRQPAPNAPLVEVPISTAYSRAPFGFWNSMYQKLDLPVARVLSLRTIVARLGILKRITLSPETDSARDMLLLTRRLLDQGVRFLHLFWHSPSMVPGLTPFSASHADVDRLYATIADYVEGLAKLTEIEPATVGEVARALAPVAEGRS